MAPHSTSRTRSAPRGTSAVAVAALAAVVCALAVVVAGFDDAGARGIGGIVGLVFVAAQLGWLAAALVLTGLGLAGTVDDDDTGAIAGGAVRLDVPLGLIGTADNDDVEDDGERRHTARVMVLRRAQ